jgi:hypothetical protein
MKTILSLRERGYFAALDSELARVLGRLAKESDLDVLLGAALASRVVRDGDVCVDLGALAGSPGGGHLRLQVSGARRMA